MAVMIPLDDVITALSLLEPGVLDQAREEGFDYDDGSS
jgi:hypothetical protein